MFARKYSKCQRVVRPDCLEQMLRNSVCVRTVFELGISSAVIAFNEGTGGSKRAL